MIRADSRVITNIKLIAIGLTAGAVLAESLRFIHTISDIDAYNLLFNFDYIPVIGIHSNTSGWSGMTFHYFTCVSSVLVSYHFFKIFKLEKKALPYVGLFFIGSAMLYFLTGLSPEPPVWNDWLAFSFFGLAHLLYAIIVVKLIRVLINERKVRLEKSANLSS